LHGVFVLGVADHGLIQGAAPVSSSATMRAETSAYKSRFMRTPLALADATKRGRVAIAASGPQAARIENSPPGVHGQAPRLSRAETCVENM
jgi:hypothetical protein